MEINIKKLYDVIATFETQEEQKQIKASIEINNLIKNAPINLQCSITRGCILNAMSKTYGYEQTT